MAASALALLLVIAGYFLLQAPGRLHRHPQARRRAWPAQVPHLPAAALVPVVVAVAATTALASIATFLLKGPTELAAAAWWMLGCWCSRAPAPGGCTGWPRAARRCAGPGPSEDRRLRVLLAQRGARVFGGVAFVIAGVLATPSYWVPTSTGFGEGLYADLDPSGFQITCLVLGLALCVLPAATAYRAPQPASHSPFMSNH